METTMHIALIQSGGASNALLNFVPIVAIIGIFWFMVILPASKQRKKTQEMLGALKKNDRVLTSGGIYGTVQSIEGEVVSLKIAENVKIRVARTAITGVTSEVSE